MGLALVSLTYHNAVAVAYPTEGEDSTQFGDAQGYQGKQPSHS